jgi:DNA-directed RNA polymerase subunit N (RpoN/RPB10)
MNFLKRLFGGAVRPATDILPITVKCLRCGEVVRGQIKLYSEVSADYDDSGRERHFCRKVLIGSGRCFQSIEVVYTFTAARTVLSREITGGVFVNT